jgi:hypothetical protein
LETEGKVQSRYFTRRTLKRAEKFTTNPLKSIAYLNEKHSRFKYAKCVRQKITLMHRTTKNRALTVRGFSLAATARPKRN